MTQFVVEYRTRIPAGDGNFLPSLNPVNAETLQIAQRDVERVLASGAADEAVIYQPVRVVRASRTVTSTALAGVTGAGVEVS
jgi:hypothetical protein